MITKQVPFKIIVFCLLMSVVGMSLRGQDVIFSQFYNAPFQINPAFAGLSNLDNIYVNYRNQWALIPNAYQSAAVSYDKAIENSNSGFGAYIESDFSATNIYRQTRLSGLYSYNIKIKKDKYIRFGIEPIFGYSSVDASKLCFGDQIITGDRCDSNGPTTEPITGGSLTSSYFDLSMGMLYYSSRFYAGVSFKHLNNPSNNFFDSNDTRTPGIPVRLSLIAGYRYEFLEKTRDDFSAFLAPNILFARQGGFTQVNAGTLVGYRTFFIGGWLRFTTGNQDAAIFSIGSTIGAVKWSYSYDATISNLGLSNTGGSHEIGILLTPSFNKKPKSRYLNCFDIFR